jgi:hypothetical protein
LDHGQDGQRFLSRIGAGRMRWSAFSFSLIRSCNPKCLLAMHDPEVWTITRVIELSSFIQGWKIVSSFIQGWKIVSYFIQEWKMK